MSNDLTSKLEHATLVVATKYGDTTPGDPAEGDVSWRYGDWTCCAPATDQYGRSVPADQATHLIIDYAAYSDYSGSAVERSNHRSLLRDFPNTFIAVYGDFFTRALMLPLDKEPDESLVDALIALDNYPLYDEGDHSALEFELAEEAWDLYLSWDVPRDLQDKHDIPEGTLDQIGDKLKEMFYRITFDESEYPYSESATDVCFPRYDSTLETMADELRQEAQ